MPTSHHTYITDVITYVRKKQPKRILDIGVGFGKWGHLFREYTDIMAGRINKNDWQTTIHGVEIYPEYICDHQKDVYTKIFLGDIVTLIHDLDGYNFIFMSDVLEHIEKDNGLHILKQLRYKSDSTIVMLPMGKEWLGRNGADRGNEHEAHISSWEDDDMKGWNNFGTYTCGNKKIKGWLA